MTATLAIALVGALTGVLGLYLHWRQTRFSLAFEGVDLRYEPDAIEELKARSPQSLDGSFLDFQVELRLHNRGGGSGSIEKPRLELTLTDGKKYTVSPQTEEVRSEVLEKAPGMTRSRVWVERQGGSYFLDGRGRLDDVLDYTIEFAHDIDLLAVVNEFDALGFNLKFRNHRGQEKRQPIRSKSEWDELI